MFVSIDIWLQLIGAYSCSQPEPGQRDCIEESWQAGRQTPNTGISSKETLPSARRDMYTTPVCQLWRMVQRYGHSPNKHRTNWRLYRPTWKEECPKPRIQEVKDQHLGQREDNIKRHNQQCENSEVVMGRAHLPSQIRQMNVTCHQLETIYHEGDHAKRWRDDLDKYKIETIRRRTTQNGSITGHYGCPNHYDNEDHVTYKKKI